MYVELTTHIQSIKTPPTRLCLIMNCQRKNIHISYMYVHTKTLTRELIYYDSVHVLCVKMESSSNN